MKRLSPRTRIPAAKELSGLISRIYETAFDPKLWPGVLQEIASYFDAHAGIVLSHPTVATLAPISIRLNIPDEGWSIYEQEYWKEDIWVMALKEKGLHRSGLITVGEEIVPRRQMVSSRFFNECLRLTETQGLCTTIVTDGNDPFATLPTYFAFFRKPGYDEFEPEPARALMELIAPHVRNALRVFWQLGVERELRGTREKALDAMGFGVLIFDSQGRISYRNTAAREAIEQSGLKMEHDFLSAEDPAVRDRAARAIRLALQGRGTMLRLGIVATDMYWLFVPMTDRAVANAIISNRDWAGRTAMAITSVSKPLGRLELFAVAHGLTPAETRITSGLLLHEGSLGNLAKELRISTNTVRTHLKHIFAKTGCKSQRELIRELSVLPSIDMVGGMYPEQKSSKPR